MSTRTARDVAWVFDVPIDRLTVSDLNNAIAGFVDNDQHALILSVNIHCLNLAYEQPWLRQFLNEADLVFCDGAGVMLGARILGQPIEQRITFADALWDVARFAADRDYSLYFLGARPGVARKAADNLIARYPRLRIVGTQHGYFDKTNGSAENSAVIADINNAQPNLLLVGFGMPLQEKWLKDNWADIDANVAINLGAIFDFVSGELQRAPTWMNNNGLEWLGRLAIEPRRLWRRYLVGNPLFLARVLRHRFRDP